MTRTTAVADSDNPLLSRDALPPFDAIRAEHVRPALEQTLGSLREQLAQAEQAQTADFSWALELERIQEQLERVWSPVSHLNGVTSNPDLRAAYNEGLPLITEFGSELGQNEALYRHYRAVAATVPDRKSAEGMLIHNALRDFKLAGVALPADQKQRFREIMQALAARQASFEQNLMDATDAFSHHETDRANLAGLPESVLERAGKAARDKGMDGWLLALDPPTFQSVVTHADSERLREIFYSAWITRASDQGPHAGDWDNGPLMEEILALRHEAAQLLGFLNYAELSLATKMAASPDEVISFLRDLAHRSRSAAGDELAMLEQHAQRPLKPWDVPYYAERLRQDRFALAEEELRPYFPLPRVLEGLFEVSSRLFGLQIRRAEFAHVWHPDVTYYEISDREGSAVGSFFVDLFARPNKRGGAWMDVCANRIGLKGHHQLPIAHLVCNFAPPVGDRPSLLTHSDTVTLFHEFGHTLHHLLTEVDYPSLAGINGVPWDAVELPSQFLENYAWLPDVLKRICRHYETGAPLPEDKIATLTASRSFLAGLAMARQLEFALFDFRLHHEFDPAAGARVYDILNEVRQEVAVIRQPEYNRFANTFAHIFGGGYAAGYYSYKWAEVLAADAFSAFEEQGIFDARTAQQFRKSILAVGGSRDAMDAFIGFRGRPPRPDALLRHAGLTDGDRAVPA
jgi:oligopeptidase A